LTGQIQFWHSPEVRKEDQMTRKLIPTLAIAMLTVACGGNSEPQNVEDALEEMTDAMEEATEEMADAMQEVTGDAMEEAAEEMADALEEATEEMTDAMEEAAKELEAVGLGDVAGAAAALEAAMEAAGS
jgi:histone H3/H4